MSFIDKIMNVMHLNTDDEDDEDFTFGSDDYDLEEEEPIVEKRHSRRAAKESGYAKEPLMREKPAVKTAPNITAFNRSSKKQMLGMEVVVVRPTSVEDAREITETLLNGRTVFLNMEGLNVEIAQRIIDFTSGSCFAISGNLQKVSTYIFIITPANVDISGDLQEMFDGFDIGSMNV
ncbi:MULTISPECIES: cell division protein SepF [Agathobacter]|uniref:Cell division protein SepF n=1 Tax=Agathobacter ruminis TaxID=1712665 RepID=A0A2G3E5R4_9FIRM|nr:MULTISPECIES: cell division protein SepF [Agathobacter]MBQ1680834.1 cell division protein SepF [Agathobacter sp.]MCR5677425.1 cell division protein SepF [Agathobacter sp.]MDC7302489.1 cell division protein SepF [Agathobacter ruminis]PHU38584.1 cell division protein SepF [Agathobacter ruminis]